MKPWAKLEIGYLSHPKFLALNANAVCLWHEGKNYCDAHQTDGIIPKYALRTFRFRGAKSVALLMRSCGDKPNGTPYAALWEQHAIGYRMHDYLDYNDCRDEVLARMEQADRGRDLDREYKRRARAAKKAVHESRLEESSLVHVRSGQRPDGDRTVRLYTETETETKERSERTAPTRSPGPRVGLLRAPRPEAAFDGGRVWVLHKTHRDFLALRNNEPELLAWYAEVAEDWNRGAHAASEPGANMFKFWEARYAEKWPTAAPINARIPAWAR